MLNANHYQTTRILNIYLEGIFILLRCRDYDEKGFCLKGDLCKFDHGTDAVVLEVHTRQLLGDPEFTANI